VPDLKGHHSQCELNFYLCLSLVPGCREGMTQWAFTIGDEQGLHVSIKLLDSAPYTSTIEIQQQTVVDGFLSSPKVLVRLYHDVQMAEVVAWDQHRHWRPVYSYPNKRMYHNDEKLALNRFLGDWLVHCRKQGIISLGSVNKLS